MFVVLLNLISNVCWMLLKIPVAQTRMLPIVYNALGFYNKLICLDLEIYIFCYMVYFTPLRELTVLKNIFL